MQLSYMRWAGIVAGVLVGTFAAGVAIGRQTKSDQREYHR